MKIKYFAFLSIVLTIVTFSFAGNVTATIESIITLDNNDVMLVVNNLEAYESTPDALCPENGMYKVFLPTSTYGATPNGEAVKKMYASILAAYSAGNKIRFGYYTKSGQCIMSWVRIFK